MSQDSFPKFLESDVELKVRKVEILQEKLKLQRELPHKYGWKNYKWQTEFLMATEHEVFLTAANQIGKSSIQIRKCIEWATNPGLWPSLWRTPPKTFFYFYPSSDMATREILKKWIPDFLPKGSMKDHPQYGWELEKRGPHIHAIHFKTGVSVYMVTYSQDIMNLQGTTVWAVFCDEELPEDYWDELNFRRMAHNGYFHMVFTATRGEKLWFDTMERVGTPEEKFKGAWKRQISLFDCQFFEDGTPSHWTDEVIKKVILFCKSEAEVLRRVWGRFVKEGGLKYGGFSREKNRIAEHDIPPDWHWYCGVDIGAGGADNHPSTIVFVAINPDLTDARVVRAWKGDKEVTTDLDVFNKFIEMKGEQGFEGLFYDYHAKDFHTIATRNGVPFQPADKRHSIGEGILNVLFKTGRLLIFDTPEMEPLVYELTTLDNKTDKRKAIDDLCDGLRYALSRVPFNWEKLGIEISGQIPPAPPVISDLDRQLAERRKGFREENVEIEDIEQEMEAANELYSF